MLLLGGCGGPLSTLDPLGPGAAAAARLWWIMAAGSGGLLLCTMLVFAVVMIRPSWGARLGPGQWIVCGGLGLPALVLPPLLGHPLHGQTVHFPIALVFATLGADIFYWYSGDEFWLRAGLWASGFAFFAGLAAGFFGTMELLLVKGIRVRVASWTHAVAAVTLIAVAGTNWGVRITDLDDTLPHGLMLSVLAAFMTGLAGWHGGKLVYDHGIGIFISSKK